jgi:hypothetical protein
MVALKREIRDQLSVDYDRGADVLYITYGVVRPGYGDDGPDDVILRYSLQGDAPIGATIIGYSECGWRDRHNRLANIVSNHLGLRFEEVINALNSIDLRAS